MSVGHLFNYTTVKTNSTTTPYLTSHDEKGSTFVQLFNSTTAPYDDKWYPTDYYFAVRYAFGCGSLLLCVMALIGNTLIVIIMNKRNNRNHSWSVFYTALAISDTLASLQFDYGQMSIGHSVIEESLLETQDNLADTEAKLNQSERELRDARRYKDKYRLLQKKYEDVYKERDKMSHLAKSLKEQLNKANTAQKEEHEDKGQLTSVLEEKKLLELQLQKISDKLLEATTNFSVSQSQHIQELQQWKEQCSNMVDLQKYTKLQIDLVDNQRSLRDLQGIVKNKEESSTNKFKETSEKHHEQVKWLENQKDALSRQLTTLQNILDGQIDKFKQQYEASERRNALVVDLYKENADLIDSLYYVERQKKEAISRCYKLEDQCINLRKMLKRVAKVAIT